MWVHIKKIQKGRKNSKQNLNNEYTTMSAHKHVLITHTHTRSRKWKTNKLNGKYVKKMRNDAQTKEFLNVCPRCLSFSVNLFFKHYDRRHHQPFQFHCIIVKTYYYCSLFLSLYSFHFILSFLSSLGLNVCWKRDEKKWLISWKQKCFLCELSFVQMCLVQTQPPMGENGQ